MAVVLTGAHLLAAKNTTDERHIYSFAETCNMIRNVQDNDIQRTRQRYSTYKTSVFKTRRRTSIRFLVLDPL